MKWLLMAGFVLGLLEPLALAQTPPAQSPLGPQNSPKEVVEGLWNRATEGELLTLDGWNRASGLFAQRDPWPGNREVRIVSNYWGVGPVFVNPDTAEADVDYTNEGEIDSFLRYTPPPKTPYFKTSLVFHLILVPEYAPVYGPDGKTVVSKKPTGSQWWQIQGPRGLPWTTVNTAIRYVLDMRDKTTDPSIKKNADETLAKLMKLH
jgi:hypothetical protein